MDRISELSDELLVKILSLLPTKVAVSTTILSKRWECLWMWLPKLDYFLFSGSKRKGQSLRCFLNRTLPLHRAPFIESLRLCFGYSSCKPEDVRLWVAIAVSQHLRELDIYYSANPEKHNILPSSLYVCKSLSVLKLSGRFLLEVPRKVLLPCMKTLQLEHVNSVDGESLRRLLCICPVLENLSVDFCDWNNVGKIIVNVLSLKCLSLNIPDNCYHDGLEMNTPSLKYLKLYDLNTQSPLCLIENMPEMEESYLDVRFPNLGSLIGAMTSVKRLTIGSEAEDLYGNGFVFNKLEHLKLYECTGCSFNLLASLLRDSPNLRALDISPMHEDEDCDMSRWNQPLTVPACFVSSLQTFKWSGYFGRPQETEVAVYILKNACLLKTATFMSNDRFVPKLKILKELSLTSRASTTCQLVFN